MINLSLVAGFTPVFNYPAFYKNHIPDSVNKVALFYTNKN